jgi:23S rRNA (guanosine2251-2'-O)-methyltransferase
MRRTPARSARRATNDEQRGTRDAGHATNSPAWVVGFHAVLAAVERQAELIEILLVLDGPDGRQRRILDAARARGVRFRLVPRRDLDAVAGGAAHNGFAARLSTVPFADAGALLDRPSPTCLLALDAVEDPHNLGAAVRIAAALGLGGVIVAGPHPPPLGGAVAKVAAGTLPLVPVAHVPALGDFARQAKEAGFWVYGAAADGERVTDVELPERCVLCLGAEATGLRAKTRTALDGTVAIPLAAGVDSLNLSVAAGILAWEWRRRFPVPPGSATANGDPGSA